MGDLKNLQEEVVSQSFAVTRDPEEFFFPIFSSRDGAW
jgi:hypothetical protein